MLAKAYDTKQTIREIAALWVKPVSKVEPGHQETYNSKFKIYKKIYPVLKKLQ